MMKLNLPHCFLTVTVSLLGLTTFCSEIKAQNRVVVSNHDRFIASSLADVETNFLHIINEQFFEINSQNHPLNLNHSYQIAQNSDIQSAVNVIHQLRRERKITVGIDDTKIFGQLRVSTTKSGRGSYSNWITITIIPENRGYNFVAIGENSYRLHSIYANGESTLCPSNCPVYSGQ